MALVQDAYRFVMYHKGAIECSPLQAYVSALLFSPAASLVRRLFQREEPDWITIKPAMRHKQQVASICHSTCARLTTTNCGIKMELGQS